MKEFLLIGFFFIGVINHSFSQIIKEPKSDTIKLPQKKKTTFSVFGGMGVGGTTTGEFQGFSYGFTGRFRYRFHTFDMYMSHTGEHYAFVNKDASLIFDSYNFGLTYGIGIYGKHCYTVANTGIGFTNTTLVPYYYGFENNSFGTPSLITSAGIYGSGALALTYINPTV